MKRNVSFLLLILFILAISNLVLFAEEAKYDFRKTNWGMSKEQLKATEKGAIVLETDQEVEFMVPDFSNNFKSRYLFLEDKLYQSFYLSIGYYANYNFYIDDYEGLKESLTKKYGTPKGDKILWKDDLWKDNKIEWGSALHDGDLTYEASWETSTTLISLTLSADDDHKIIVSLKYESKKLKEWAKK